MAYIREFMSFHVRDGLEVGIPHVNIFFNCLIIFSHVICMYMQ